MGLKNYGVLRGRVTGARREDDQDTPHYQIRVAAAGVDYRLAVNVKSQLSPSELLFLVIEDFRHPLTERLPAVGRGLHVTAQGAGHGRPRFHPRQPVQPARHAPAAVDACRGRTTT